MNKNKINNFFKSLQPILIFCLIINVVLLSYIYYLKVNNHIYFFSGKNEYVSIDGGNLSLNYDVNYIMGNNIEFVQEKDMKIKELKVGYYIIEEENIKEIIEHYEKFDESVSLSNELNNITNLNVSESTKENMIFKNINGKDLENKIYFIMELKLDNNEKIVSKLKLDVSKIR